MEEHIYYLCYLFVSEGLFQIQYIFKCYLSETYLYMETDRGTVRISAVICAHPPPRPEESRALLAFLRYNLLNDKPLIFLTPKNQFFWFM